MSDDVGGRSSAPLPDESRRRSAPGRSSARLRAREPVSWQRRNRPPLLAAAVVIVAILALALVARPGARRKRARLGHAQQAHFEAESALTALPAGGSLLVNSSRGPWIVHPDGSTADASVAPCSSFALASDHCVPSGSTAASRCARVTATCSAFATTLLPSTTRAVASTRRDGRSTGPGSS